MFALVRHTRNAKGVKAPITALKVVNEQIGQITKRNVENKFTKLLLFFNSEEQNPKHEAYDHSTDQ